MKEIYLIFIILSFLSSCSSPVNEEFDRGVPSSVRTFLQEEGLYSVLISKNGNLILEEYFNGKTKDTLTNIQSLTKSIISILVGIAIEQHYVIDENQSIAAYFPDQFMRKENDKKREITIGHILNQTSGLKWRGHREHAGWLRSPDQVHYVLSKKLEDDPGLTYHYNSGATHLLSGIIANATGMTTLDFAREFLFDPIGISRVCWEKRNDGYHDGAGFGLKMRPIDLLKIGQLLLNGGRSNGKRIITEEWGEKLFNRENKLSTDWGLPGSTHGFCWYQVQYAHMTINYAMGYGGQFIFLIPEKNLVIVTTHNHDAIKGARQQRIFLKEKLNRLILEFS